MPLKTEFKHTNSSLLELTILSPYSQDRGGAIYFCPLHEKNLNLGYLELSVIGWLLMA